MVEVYAWTVPVASFLAVHPRGRLLFGHDPAQWETIPRAPAPVI